MPFVAEYSSTGPFLGGGGLLSHLKNLLPWVKEQKRRNLREAAPYLEAEWKKTVDTPGTREHPSAPGEPPHKVTGEMQASLSAQVFDLDLVLVGSKVAIYTDRGTKRMKARPHVEPTMIRARPKLLEILARKGR